jgi:hypothetical protein
MLSNATDLTFFKDFSVLGKERCFFCSGVQSIFSFFISSGHFFELGSRRRMLSFKVFSLPCLIALFSFLLFFF